VISSLLIGVGKNNLQYLQKLQNKAMRIIIRCNRRIRIVDMLETFQFMSINERIEYNVCLLINKIINGLCPSYLRDKVNLVQHVSSINTRQRDRIRIEKCRTNEEQRSLLHNGFKMYNDPPNELKRERNLKCFRRLLIQYIKRRK